MTAGKHYFVSDVHLGLRAGDPERVERRFLAFLDALPEDTLSLYLLGDIFDFWYEYRYVIPSGHIRVLGRLAALTDRGVEVFFFPGNHDVWAYGFFERELGIRILRQPAWIGIGGTRFCLGHGDGLGPVDTGYRLLRSVFHNRFLQVLFSALHPRWAFALGYAWSRHSRLSKDCAPDSLPFRGEADPLWQFAALHEQEADCFIFGHLHTPADVRLPGGSRLLILGDWSHGAEYAVLDGGRLELLSFPEPVSPGTGICGER